MGKVYIWKQNKYIVYTAEMADKIPIAICFMRLAINKLKMWVSKLEKNNPLPLHSWFL